MKLVGYCRVSTALQKENETIDIQLTALKDYAIDSEDELITIFEDDGYSGSLEDRPGLAELFAYLDEHSGIVDGLLIYRLDRLARDLVLQETLISQLERRGVKIISTREPDLDGNDPTRVLIRQIFGMIAQYERALITLRLTSGRLRKASLGRFAGGGIPTGYSSTDKELTVDPDRMAHVGLIYKLRSEGNTLRDIATALNQQKIPVPRDAKQWWPGAVGYILHNKTYKGLLTYKQHTVERPDLVLPMTD